jgi:protein-tyrosine-phosphatase
MRCAIDAVIARRATMIRMLGTSGRTLLAGAVLASVWAAAVSADTAQAANARPATVLFMCPHGAAKSVLASAYFARAARERGLNVRVISAGTEPDEQVAPAVAAHLRKHGYPVPAAKPRRATTQDFAEADVVISIGCDVKDLPAGNAALRDWSDVPDLSAGFSAADDKIREKVLQLVDELARRIK